MIEIISLSKKKIGEDYKDEKESFINMFFNIMLY